MAVGWQLGAHPALLPIGMLVTFFRGANWLFVVPVAALATNVSCRLYS